METLHRLQYLRGLAAFLVVLSHALIKLDRICEIQGWPPLGLRIDGTFGVDIFFVISGFLMSTTAAREFGAGGAPSRFLLRRVIRIVPLYWLFVAIEVALRIIRPEAAGARFGAGDVLLSLAFIPYGLDGGIFRPVVGLGWSLDYEMFFYVIFAAGLVLRRDAGLALICAGLLGLVLVGGAAQPANTAAVAWTAPLLLEFMFGMLLGRLSLAMRERGWFLPVRWPFLLAIGLVILETTFFPGSDLEALGWRPLHWLLAALIVALAALTAPDRNFESSAPGRLLKGVGDSSYSLYLFHALVLTVTARLWMTLGLGRDWLPVYFVLAVLATLPAAWLLYLYVERPVTRALTVRLAPRARERSGAIAPLAPAE
ncbi:acyltransferase [Enterovirga sp.]|uniref:acyltransferase family protein n=1 Tax=Enterovirga sp. TaxID=2026350 RepID=UPI002CE777E3|nr:acyltransferase [Enterovirga sp.]HMO28203.1 acyltransferase [Enterovirga sp.]